MAMRARGRPPGARGSSPSGSSTYLHDERMSSSGKLFAGPFELLSLSSQFFITEDIPQLGSMLQSTAEGARRNLSRLVQRLANTALAIRNELPVG